jgi:hypothetical protein
MAPTPPSPMFAPLEDPAAMALALSAPDPADEPPRLVAITPWIDPVVDTRGYDPRSRYVELFWLGTLGPTATWLLRRLVAGLDEHPDGYRLDLAATARAMGLSYHTGTAGPFGRALARCVMFGIAHQHSDGFAVRRRLPEVARRHLARLPPEVQAAHDVWLATVPTLDDLQRGRLLADAMVAAGDDRELVESQLVRLGIPAATAADLARAG